MFRDTGRFGRHQKRQGQRPHLLALKPQPREEALGFRGTKAPTRGFDKHVLGQPDGQRRRVISLTGAFGVGGKGGIEGIEAD